MASSRLIRGQQIDPETRSKILESVRVRGVTATARILGLSDPTILRVCGNLGLYPGTITLLRMQVDKLATSEAPRS
jgi:hypothetical protein